MTRTLNPGIAYAIPLILFAAAAKRVRYSDLGLLQYLAPTLQLVLAVGVYGERLRVMEWAAFALIRTALALYARASVAAGRCATAAP